MENTAMLKQCQELPRRKLRFMAFLGLRELSRQAGVDSGHLSRWERGLVGMGPDKVARIAKILGVSPEILNKSNE
jgi:transcriptional regulator with XRE-family HTH domain